MEEELLNTEETGKNYHENKNIKLKKGRGRPKKITPTPTPEVVEPVSLDDYYKEWVLTNRKEFFNYNHKSREFLKMVYQVYNHIFRSNKKITSCGTCRADVISAVKQYYFNEI